MAPTARRAITLSVLVIGAAAILVCDLHRLAIAAVWPYFVYLFAI